MYLEKNWLHLPILLKDFLRTTHPLQLQTWWSGTSRLLFAVVYLHFKSRQHLRPPEVCPEGTIGISGLWTWTGVKRSGFSSAIVQPRNWGLLSQFPYVWNEVHDPSLKETRGIHGYKSTIKSQELLLLFIIVIITTTPAVINDIETVQCIKLWTTVDSGENIFSWYSHYCLTPTPEVANSSAVKDVYQMDEEKWLPPLWSSLPEQIVTTAEKCLWLGAAVLSNSPCEESIPFSPRSPAPSYS